MPPTETPPPSNPVSQITWWQHVARCGKHSPEIHRTTGWWARATPLKNMKDNWDDIWENEKWQPNHQPVVFFCLLNLVHQM